MWQKKLADENNQNEKNYIWFSDVIADSVCEFWCWCLSAKISSPVLSLCNGLEDGFVDPVCFVIELQVAQHHDSTQHKSSRVRKVLEQSTKSSSTVKYI